MKKLIFKSKVKSKKARSFIIDHLSFIAFLTLCLCVSVVNLQAQGTEFTYQGRLLDNTLPPTANYDFEFSLWDALANGNQQGTTQTVTGVAVANGIFTVRLNFGAQFSGAARFLQIAVRPAGSGAYTTLAPRQPITSSPYSIKSASSTSADGLSVACNLCVTDAHILSIDGAKITGIVANATNAVNAANATNATSALSATTAVNVTGVVAIANGGTGSATQNFVDLSTNQIIAGRKTFADPNNQFFGDGSQLTNVVAAKSNNARLLGLLRWDLLSGKRTFPVLGNPGAIVSDNTHIFVLVSNTIRKIRSSDGVAVATFLVSNGQFGLVYDGANLWVSTGNDVKKINPTDGTVLGTFTIGISTYRMIFDGENIWALSRAGNNLTKLRASDGVNLGTFPVGGDPTGLAFDGNHLWILNQGTNNIMEISRSDGSILNTFSFGAESALRNDLVFDGTYMYALDIIAFRFRRIRVGDGLTETFGNVGCTPQSTNMAFDGESIWYGCPTQNIFGGNVGRTSVINGVAGPLIKVLGDPYFLNFDGEYVWSSNLTSLTGGNEQLLRIKRTITF